MTKTRDLGWSERLIIAPLIILIVFLGVYPKPVLDRITPSVNRLVVHVDQVTHTPVPSSLARGGRGTDPPPEASAADRARRRPPEEPRDAHPPGRGDLGRRRSSTPPTSTT